MERVRVVLAFVAFLLVVVPVLDLALNDSVRDESRGIHCPIHANPVVTFHTVSPVPVLSPELLLPSEPRLCFPPASHSIFVPPRG
jgi:hypothetical protein